MALHLALTAYMALNGVDLAQTVGCLKASRCREANHVMAVFEAHPAALGAVKIGLDSAAVLAIVKMRAVHPRMAWGLAILGIAVEGAAVAHNARVMR